MSKTPMKASDPNDLERRILDPNIAKSEAEWWAKSRIEELEAELRTRDNAEATHRITLRGVQAETMRVQTQCDALQADNARLRDALDEAATSLETIQLRSYGDESYLNHMDQVRGFAGSRAGVAKEAIAKVRKL